MTNMNLLCQYYALALSDQNSLLTWPAQINVQSTRRGCLCQTLGDMHLPNQLANMKALLRLTVKDP